MFAYLDGDFFYKAVEHLHKGGKPEDLKKAGLVPDLTKRGAVRSVYDGHHVFTRYFSPKQHNRPTTIEDLYRVNDVELFDVSADPAEMNNLAIGPKTKRELVLAMLRRTLDQRIAIDVAIAVPCPAVLADPGQLEAALLNIAINARDAMRQGRFQYFALVP